MTQTSRRIALVLLGLSFLSLGAERVAAQDVLVNERGVQTLTTLPAAVRSPEGLTADPNGNLFVSTNNGGGQNVLLRLDRSGKVTGQLSFPAPLLGVEFNPRDMKIYIASVGALTGGTSKIQRVPANFGANTPIEDVANVPNLPAPQPRMEMNPDNTQSMITFADSPAVPNGLVFRASDGALFFSDSFQAAIFRINDPTSAQNTCANATNCVQMVIQDGRLAAIGSPQFGANGVAFNPAGTALFIANTGDDRVFSLDLQANTLSLFASVNGADGLRSGPGNTLLVTANQSDQIVILDAITGRTLAVLGAFLGTTSDGAPIGLSTPASVVVVDNRILVTNLTSGRPAMPAMMMGAAANAAAPAGLFTIARLPFPGALANRAR